MITFRHCCYSNLRCNWSGCLGCRLKTVSKGLNVTHMGFLLLYYSALFLAKYSLDRIIPPSRDFRQASTDLIYCFRGFRMRPRKRNRAFSPFLDADTHSLQEGCVFLPFCSLSRRAGERQNYPDDPVNPV